MTTTPAPEHLFHPDNVDAYRAHMVRGVDVLSAHLASRGRRPVRGLSPRDAERAVAAVDLDRPLGDAGQALAELGDLWLDETVWFHEPTYAAHLNCPVVIPSLLAEVFVSGVNASLDTFDQSTTGTFVERALVDWTARRIGFDDVADGVFTSGGSQSNLQALLLARGEAQASGRADVGPLRIFASADAHFSVDKSARLLGLGDDAVVPVAVDGRRRMDPGALAAAMAASVARGEVPMAVVATAGTTDFGAIDPLAEVADLAHTHGAWCHVDAAYGGGLLVSPTHRHLLDGVEQADSVTVDFHKTWFQPVSASALVVRDAAALRHVTWHADYLNPLGHEHPNQVDKSLQTTRRFDALKVWLSLRIMGADTIGAYLDDVLALTRALREELRAYADIEVAAEPYLSTLVLRYRPVTAEHGADLLDEAALGELNRRIRSRLYESGRAMVAATKVDGRQFLKLTLLNPAATLDDLLEVVALVRGAGRDLLPVVVPAPRSAAVGTGVA